VQFTFIGQEGDTGTMTTQIEGVHQREEIENLHEKIRISGITFTGTAFSVNSAYRKAGCQSRYTCKSR